MPVLETIALGTAAYKWYKHRGKRRDAKEESRSAQQARIEADNGRQREETRRKNAEEALLKEKFAADKKELEHKMDMQAEQHKNEMADMKANMEALMRQTTAGQAAQAAHPGYSAYPGYGLKPGATPMRAPNVQPRRKVGIYEQMRAAAPRMAARSAPGFARSAAAPGPQKKINKRVQIGAGSQARRPKRSPGRRPTRLHA